MLGPYGRLHLTNFPSVRTSPAHVNRPAPLAHLTPPSRGPKLTPRTASRVEADATSPRARPRPSLGLGTDMRIPRKFG
eukprot:1182009-Prorocentrum_minimum.AAC.8